MIVYSYLDEPNEEQNAPMRLSNLDTNILENYGEGEIAFTQNTVPFDFDGNRLMYDSIVYPIGGCNTTLRTKE